MKAAAWGLLAAVLAGCPRGAPPPKEARMNETMPSGPGSSYASRLLADYRSVGLYQEMPAPGFYALLTSHFRPEQLEESWEETKDQPDALRYGRHFVLARIRGVIQDVGFAAADVLAQVKRRIPELAWDAEQRGPIRTVGKIRLGERRIVLRLGARERDWTYSLVSGLMEGVNRLLQDADRPERFVSLDTDGDYYAYVVGDAGLEGRMAASPWFKLKKDPDPLVR